MVGGRKGAVEIEFGTFLILALIFGFVAVVIILILSGKWNSALDYLRNFLRFGG